MGGVYIHIPFCRQKCNYCNFFSVASKRLRKGFSHALLREINQRKDYLKEEVVNSIYFGGGTPSVLSIQELQNIMDGIASCFQISKKVEITIELNPEDVAEKYIQGLLKMNFNRFSIGVQSFHDDDLQRLSRNHDAKRAIESVRTIKESGSDNISLDLIYGIPGSDDNRWKRNIDHFLELEIPHLSAYALTVEENTPLHWMISKKKFPVVAESTVVKQYDILVDKMAREGYMHYEISNFAKVGFYSRHNSIYWLGGNYAGFGPSAHSYNGMSREWNAKSISGYITGSKGKIVEEREILSEQEKYNEYLLTSLRTIWGCDAEHIENVFGRQRSDNIRNKMVKYIDNELVKRKQNTYFLTEKGMLLSDGILSDLFE